MITNLILTFVATMVLYFAYKLLFRNSNRFQLNRIVLLTISIFAFALPFIRINIEGQQFQEMPSFKQEMDVIFYSDAMIEAPVETKTLSITDIISYLYIIGVVFFLMKFVYNIFKIYKIKAGKKIEKIDNVNFIYTNESHVPFSFLKNIYIPIDNLDEMIIKHEMSHVKNHHSVDVILMEIMIAFQWFNPFIRMIKNELKNNHEFIADSEAIKNEDEKSNYMMLLLQQCTADDFSTIANNFSFLLTKKRISMITKNQKVKGSVIKVLLTLPVFALLILLNTQCDNTKPNDGKQSAPVVENNSEETQSNLTSVQKVGSLAGTVYDAETKQPLAANVILEKDENEFYNTTADKNGKYEFTSVVAGRYDLKAWYEGYNTYTVKTIYIPADKFSFIDISLIDGKRHPRKDKNSSSQKPQATQDSIHRVTEVMPQYPGGPNEMMKYIQENIKYPQSAKDNKIEGRVFVSFVVEKDGSITNAAVMRGIDKECDAEALRVVSSMPKWTPGQHKGEVVRTQFTIPIYYKFN
ncbi:MAG: TonB family protein [Bacteroidales bacterium]|nr:TonB family protein [Bacteroidales bacterium]